MHTWQVSIYLTQQQQLQCKICRAVLQTSWWFSFNHQHPELIWNACKTFTQEAMSQWMSTRVCPWEFNNSSFITCLMVPYFVIWTKDTRVIWGRRDAKLPEIFPTLGGGGRGGLHGVEKFHIFYLFIFWRLPLISCMNCANIWGPSDQSGRLQRRKP